MLFELLDDTVDENLSDKAEDADHEVVDQDCLVVSYEMNYF